MKYIEHVNALIRKNIGDVDNLVCFGQNISAGSCISGMTKGLKVKSGSMVINTQNSENSLVGIGFGLMLSGVNAIFFMKQLDFLILGIDHIVNTYNIVRQENPKASFTIVAVVVDSGYEGPQSAFNSFADICSIARVSGYTVTNKADAEEILSSKLVAPGFRIIGISQRLFKTELIELEKSYSNPNSEIFQYMHGKDVTIACFNMSLPYGLELQKKLAENNIHASLFSVNAMTPIDWHKLLEDVKAAKNLVILDDSKSANKSCHMLMADAYKTCHLENCILVERELSPKWFRPTSDAFEISYEKIIAQLNQKHY